LKMKVAVAGAAGRMGREVCRTVALEDGMELVCAFDPMAAGKTLQSLVPETQRPLVITGDRGDMLAAGAEIMVDFTVAAAALENIPFALSHGIHVVAGTTGFSDADIDKWRGLAEEHGAHCLIAPNFAIGAILLMKFAAVAARYMPDCEIIELHHPFKLDAPSGTARLTAEKVAEALEGATAAAAEGTGPPAASRGMAVRGIPVHSVRLPGLVAHQEIIFGGQGQTLSIRHDSIDRTSFMPGVVFALRRITEHPGLTIGLENWMEE
jgi:4-hydroxy-tetrahydrodipicolinate reductase